ncbi:MAG: type II toxin-antitoxin system RelE family toxin [Minisyncoccota bacterium]
MREIEKLLRKITKKERQMLLSVVEALIANRHQGIDIKKLKGSDFYRARRGSFRIIFHYNDKEEVIVDSVRLRKEGTYKDFS